MTSGSWGGRRCIHAKKAGKADYGVAFSFHVINGGYMHRDGNYTDENTLELTLLNVTEEKVMEIARDLCAFFRQESVMVVYNNIDKVVFVEEKL